MLFSKKCSPVVFYHYYKILSYKGLELQPVSESEPQPFEDFVFIVFALPRV